jgi:iron complex transport system permease protein
MQKDAQKALDRGEVASYHRHIRMKWTILFVLLLVTILCMLIAIKSGAAALKSLEIMKTILGSGSQREALIVWKIRMPRVTAALIAGSGLSISGCVMQNTLKNPLASPFTLGISNAAAFGANVAIILLGAGSVKSISDGAIDISNPYLVTLLAFLCSMGAVLVILGLARYHGLSPEAIILAGVALGAIFTAGISIIQYFASDIEVTAALFWTFGDLGRASGKEVVVMAIPTVAAIGYFYYHRWDYNALDNGEEFAKSLGVPTDYVRLFGLLVAALITSISVSFLGMIGYIGLIGPQIMRRIVGSDHRFLIPASALAGAIILLISDTLAKTIISPIVLPVGAITSLLGGPMFLYLLMKRRKGRVRYASASK